MVSVNIDGREYTLKYTLESWRNLKDKCGINPTNIQEKVWEDPAALLSNLVFYGLSIDDRKTVTIEQIDVSLGFDVMDKVFEAVTENMPKSGKELSASEGADGPGKK